MSSKRKGQSRNKRLLCLIAATSLSLASDLSAETITPDKFSVLAANCAPSVDPEIMAKIVRTESGFKRFAIGVNGKNRKSYNPKSKQEAAKIAKKLIADGHNIDMGLGQINSKNLQWLNLSVDTVFDSCTNLKAAETVLRDGYDRARAQGSGPKDALHKALSAYNTGTFTRGFSNGYVKRVMGANVSAPTVITKKRVTRTAENAPPTWDVFSSGSSSSTSTELVFN